MLKCREYTTSKWPCEYRATTACCWHSETLQTAIDSTQALPSPQKKCVSIGYRLEEKEKWCRSTVIVGLNKLIHWVMRDALRGALIYGKFLSKTGHLSDYLLLEHWEILAKFCFYHNCYLCSFKVTVYLQGCLASKRCSASGLNCKYLNPYIKLKLIELQ